MSQAIPGPHQTAKIETNTTKEIHNFAFRSEESVELFLWFLRLCKINNDFVKVLFTAILEIRVTGPPRGPSRE